MQSSHFPEEKKKNDQRQDTPTVGPRHAENVS